MDTEKKVIITFAVVLVALLMVVYTVNSVSHTARISALNALVAEVLSDIADGDYAAARPKVDQIRLENDDSKLDKRRFESIRKSLVTIIDGH